MLQYHHSRSLDSVVYGEVQAKLEYTDEYLRDAYSWLEKKVGFYPLFVAVGSTEQDIMMTGYQMQWKRLISSGPKGKEYVKKGEAPNYVLFSFEDVSGVFTDYDYWHIALNSSYRNYQLTKQEERWIFKPSWPKSKWLRKADKNPLSVQLVAPMLYLPDAQAIWARNQETRKLLMAMGFENIEVKRLLLE